MRKIFVLLILIGYQFLTSMIFDSIFDNENFQFELYSYHGMEYFPITDKTPYLKKTMFFLEKNISLHENISIGLKLKYLDQLQNEKIIVDSLSFKRKIHHFVIQYRLFDKRYGANSYLGNVDVYSSQFHTGLLENYRFEGLEIGWDNKSYAIIAGLGGNEHNRSMAYTEISKQWHDQWLKAGVLYASRSNLSNQKNFLFHVDSKLKFSFISNYCTGCYEMNLDSENYTGIKRFQLYDEVIISITKNFRFGGSCQFDRKDTKEKITIIEKSDSFSGMIEYSKKNFSILLRNDYKDTNLYINRKMQSIFSIFINSFWQLSLNVEYFYPENFPEYYQIGFQTVIKYAEK